MASNVMGRTAKASMALTGARMAGKLIDFLMILLLARLLTPEDFALIAIAMIFVQLTEAVLDVPVFQALVKSNFVTRNMLNTAFTLSFIRSFIVVLVLLVMTPVSVILFDDPRLYFLIPALSFGPALRGLINPKMVLFARKLNFGPEATIAITSKLLTAILALPLAIYTQSYWALAVMTILAPTLFLIISYVWVPFFPSLSLRSWGEFRNMVGWAMLAQFFSAANWQATMFILAQLAPRATTGNFSVANNLTNTVHQMLVGPIIRPFISSFAEVNRSNRMQRGFLLGSRSIFVLIGPFFVVIAMQSEEITHVLFGDKWRDAPTFLSVLAICNLISLPLQLAQSTAYALDRTVYIAVQAAVTLIAQVIFVVIGFSYWGISGFLMGQILSSLVYFGVSAWVVKVLIGVDAIGIIKSLVSPVIAMICMACAIHTFHFSWADEATLIQLVSILLSAAIGGTVYLAAILSIWMASGKPDGVEKLATSAVGFAITRLRSR